MISINHCLSVSIAWLTCVNSALAWPGHDWDEWKKVTTWKQPSTRTPQSGHRLLIPPLASSPDAPQGIDTIKGWEQRRRVFATAIEEVIGGVCPGAATAATAPARGEPRVEMIREEQFDDHTRRHLRIRTEPDDWIPACLLIPRRASGRLPAMICLHQTVAQGKQEPLGIKGDPELAFAQELVARGYVCIAPDVIGFGERIPEGTQPYHDSISFYRRHPGWSFMGKMVWDVTRIVDYLRTCPEVDPLQIGCIGHSHGAYGTLFAAAFDPRISVAIASCGFTTFRSDPTPNRWSHLTALIPQIGDYLPGVEEIPFDWQHICAMIAPRSLYVWYTTQDDIFPNTDNLDAMFRDVRSVYGLYGAADELVWKSMAGPHKFPKAAREEAYRWLAQRLFPTGDLRTTPQTRKQWEAQRELLRRVIMRSLGSVSPAPESVEVKLLDKEATGRYERRLIEYAVGREERAKAYLCIPPAKTATPGVLVLHQTTVEGKRESAGLAGDASLAFGSELADRGYITLCPDSIAAGERVDPPKPFDTRVSYQRHPHVSAMGKMLADARIALTVLAKTEGVDARRLAAIGHSLGAEEALMLAAFDERVTAVVASCGYATFRAESNRLRWARDEWFSYMPTLRPVFQRGDLPPWDWDDVVRLIAPRALYHHSTRDDDIFTESESAFDAAEASRAVWRLYGRPDALVNVLRPGKHGISPETKSEMYTWLDRQLRP